MGIKGFFLRREIIVIELVAFALFSLAYFSFFEMEKELPLYLTKLGFFIFSLFALLSLFFVCENLLFKMRGAPLRFGGSFFFHLGLFFFF